ncbi:hypothetical protein A1F94_008124 [Pyrenophora tritici-repentis]|uniref:Uncharacterized protein n=1 Tax=Pyrenophora tritici-repentis TaxID=45151 RepID=A0A5M9LEA8_9PLEO|nr:hypothetical protein PtrV1_06261 [Pyrenophora tritici-repentis]KAF7450982.1 hypothetical protein A1F99_055980 [Pyrenophora tritici-repentis]KAF7573662.1 hypothetical protein PtrM4_085670 [Pyrenophora tritici-repentis]KAG9380804.1 hypothetical protein A1F94_008124 [Pyrenophora tritici-repentis]KAI0582853.1 hypothetical protein Alg215_03870 [Pyrenophora tritici-repentis]
MTKTPHLLVQQDLQISLIGNKIAGLKKMEKY